MSKTPPKKKPTPPKKDSAPALFSTIGGVEMAQIRPKERFTLHDIPVYRNVNAQDHVPREEPYLFDPVKLRELAWAIWPHDDGPSSPVLLVGPKGCGKTEMVKALAARCNQPLLRTNLTVGTTVKHLMGQRGAHDGSTLFYSGVVTRAMETGAWLLLDEISGATPHVALALFPVLEPYGEVYLNDAEPPRYVRRHPDFRVFLTDNVIGAQQEDSRFSYSGTNPDVNEALLDRIHCTIQMEYPGARQEHEIVRMRLGLESGPHDDFIKFVILVANKIRQAEDAPTFSTRMVIEWARRIIAGRIDADGKRYKLNGEQVVQAADSAFLLKMRSKADRDLVLEVLRRQLAEVSNG